LGLPHESSIRAPGVPREAVNLYETSAIDFGFGAEELQTIIDYLQLQERFAELVHVQWSNWMRHLFSKCVSNDDGSWIMARYKYQGVCKDGNGRVIVSATITVYLAGGTTAATVYAAESGGSSVGSVTSDSTDGSFSFWVDDTEYAATQRFKISISKTDFTTKTYDDLEIFPHRSIAFRTLTDQDATPSVKGGLNFITANTVGTTITDFDDGVDGQAIRVVINDANTTVDFTGTNLKGNTGADWSPAQYDHLTAVYDGTYWYCDVSDNTA